MTVTPDSRRRRLGVGAAVVLALTIAAITVLVGVLRSAAAPPELIETPADDAVVAASVYVHVSGAVAVPGLYRLDEGARVVDVIAAAGGFAEGADRDAVNLARVLTDGEQLWVPREGEGEQDARGAASGLASDGRVNLNTADATQLETLPRIGPALAARIIQWRDDNGRFTSVDDLLAVPGIGEKMLAALRELVTV